ncbi:MAG: tRNA (adenosine(37)-N6)-threonylcarbamoyltransferase complex dimerization subunit type 1 TsaB [Pseudomonadota bacterium]
MPQVTIAPAAAFKKERVKGRGLPATYAKGLAMKLMIIDTALQRCAVVLAEDRGLIAHETATVEKGHAECLAPMVQRALAVADWRVSDLARIGVVTGPGGFTGIRVGVSFARGLALGMPCGLIGITSLEALAISTLRHGTDGSAEEARSPLFIAPLVDARRGEVYTALYSVEGQALRTVTSPLALTPEVAADWLVEVVPAQARCHLPGSGRALIAASAPAPRVGEWLMNSPSVDQIELPALIDVICSRRLEDQSPAPFYLRPPDAKPSARSAFDALMRAQTRS